MVDPRGVSVPGLGGGGCDLVPTMPLCVCRKMKAMGSFSASSEGEDIIQNGCEICCSILYGKDFFKDILYEVRGNSSKTELQILGR